MAGRLRYSGGALALSVECALGAAHAAEMEVAVSIKPLHSLVAGVMAGVGEPALLVKGTGSEHSYSLRPSEARALEQADVVFWVGEPLETFLVKPVRALAGDARVVELWETPGLTLLEAREGGMWQAHEHDDEHLEAEEGAHAEEHEGEHGEADHAHGETDMHVWLDPGNAKALAGAIATVLSDADPDNAPLYQSNAARLRQQLDELDRSLENKLTPVADRPYVVFHDAYQYFERRYGMQAVGAIAVNPTLRPSAQRLGAIHERLEQLDAACVFAKPQFEPTLVDVVVEGTNARKGVLDPLGAAIDAGPAQYFQLMNDLADSLADCLGGAHSG
jgi:zinc transport system substrate-binding protein